LKSSFTLEIEINIKKSRRESCEKGPVTGVYLQNFLLNHLSKVNP